MTEQSSSPTSSLNGVQPTSAPGSAAPEQAGPHDAPPERPRRQPGDPHPYMLQRNPPNLWILVALTLFSLAITFLVLALTVLL